jgi:hypothetical protein
MPQPNRLDERARPRGGQVVFIVCVALAAGAGGTWLTRALDAAVQPGWPLALGIGGGVALGVVFFAMQGSRIVVDGDRVLTYSLHGRPNIAFDLALVAAVRPLEAGLVRGLGLELSDPKQVRFLHKAGISPERMRSWREQFGVDVVLEGFPPELAGRLLAIRDGAAA